MFGLGRISEAKIINLTSEIGVDIKEYAVDSAGKHIQQLLKGLLDYRTLAAEEYSQFPALAKFVNEILEKWQALLKELPKFSALIKKHGEHSEHVDEVREQLSETVESLRYALGGFFHSLKEAKASKK
jgi:methyl-accepting chemotaxis protein